MLLRFRIALVLALLASLFLSIPVFAGGWAVITLDELPVNVSAGEPLTIGFIVRQHGRTPMEGLYPQITASLGKDSLAVNAKPEGEVGHYTAILTFPKEGDWSWSIQAFTMDQPMPTLNVTAPIAGVASQPSLKNGSTFSLLLFTRILSLGIGLVGLAVAYRRRSRLAVGLTVACLLVGLGSFVSVSAVPEVEAQSKSSETPMSQVELGRQLFVAKGCITCHVNNKVDHASQYWTIEMGAPNLTKFSASPDILRIRLKNPMAAKSDTQMPNLGLSEDEIEALIAFINS